MQIDLFVGMFYLSFIYQLNEGYYDFPLKFYIGMASGFPSGVPIGCILAITFKANTNK